MNFTILGSGGAIRIPRACCNCNVCIEARAKGIPYKRLGQSLFLHDEHILFDTPEDINEELNLHNIDDVKHIFYSHWHPDHTLGSRIIETLMDSNTNKSPIITYMPHEQIDIAINKDNSLFSFYEYLDYCKINTDNTISFKNITIERINLLNEFAYAYIIKEADKKVLYCPCHSMHLPILEKLLNADLIIMGLGYINYTADNITSFKRDNLPIIKKLKPRKVVFTHIEESDGLSFDDFKKLEEQYENLIFSYDGMQIII
jgi:phosphoribosyl 1,2-cyclic phosphate phosphodiesterase